MSRIGISITKSVPFRNSVQEFSNVYYYDGLTALPTESEGNGLIDELTAVEKTFHSTAVTFVRGRLWSVTGSQATNQMISQKNLSGTGSTTADSTMDRERAVLVQIRAGVDSRGNPVRLKKWYHCCGTFALGAFSSTQHAQTGSLSQAHRDAIVAAMQTIGAIGGGTEVWKLCSRTGRFPDAGASFVAHPWLEHHQLGDQWRAQ